MMRLSYWATRIALLFALITVPLYANKVYTKSDYTDFSVYYKAASRAHAGNWNDVYTLADGASPFRYAPPTLPLFSPFSFLSPVTARMCWYGLQVIALGFGFYFLYLTLLLVTPLALSITSASFLFTLRFCLDSFTIGQITPFMFAGFSFSIYAWTLSRPVLASLSLFVPAVLKIGPAFCYGLFAATRKRNLWIAFWVALAVSFVAFVLGWIWSPSTAHYVALWKQWFFIVRADSAYYDASHYGSQSLNSVLLRLARTGVITSSSAQTIWSLLSGALIVGTLFIWSFRRPVHFLGRALFYSLGLFVYLWVMPETFKYAFTFLAFPIAFLLAKKPSRFTLSAIGMGYLTLSFAGKDLLPDPLFFGLQQHSVPFYVTVLLGLATLKEALLQSQASRFATRCKELISPSFLGPWATLPPAQSSLELSLIIPVRIEAGHAIDSFRLKTILESTHQQLKKLTQGSFEICVIYFGNLASREHPSFEMVEGILKTHPEISHQFARSPQALGRAAAVRDAFLVARGQFIGTLSFEQPADLSFFDRAAPLLKAGKAHLVRANRRHPESRFLIPVKWLPLVFTRHRLGLAFNALVRLVLPIQSTDTHSGSWLMSRRLATQVFLLQTSADFLLDLELSLVAKAQKLQEMDLPVMLSLSEEKTAQRMFHETLAIAIGLPILAYRFNKGYYEDGRPIPRALTADDWGLSPGVNDGIVELSRQTCRISRVSALADGAYLTHGLKDLLNSTHGVQMGIHFNLTYGKRFRSPAHFMFKWFLNRNSVAPYIEQELRSQLDTLKRAGVDTSFFDSHQHVHLVPGVLNCLAPILKEAGILTVRTPLDTSLLFTSRFSIALLALICQRQCLKLGFTTAAFCYPQHEDFRDQGRLRKLFRLNSDKEIICHPAKVADPEKWKYPDPYVHGRVQEFLALRMLDAE